jgi:RNA-directed DNA polymerase
MPQDAPPNGSAPDPAESSWSRVAGMQAKLHHWAAADPGRRFDDLFVRHEVPVCRAGVERHWPLGCRSSLAKLRTA